MTIQPSVLVLGGPNGSGKSTIAERVLNEELQVMEFVNADVIAEGLSAFHPGGASIEAGRIMLARLKTLAARNESFAFETTLASRTFSGWIQSLRENQGYRFRLVYMWLESPELNVSRVAARVRMGGHNIPEATIRRRYFRSIRNLYDLYLPLADSWKIVDNSLANCPQLVACGAAGERTEIANQKSWDVLRKKYDAAENESPD